MLADFFQLSPTPADQVLGTFDPSLVFLSYLVAVFSSYIALDITGHLRDITTSRFALNLWLLGGAFAMGAGIFSMHFVGMLAFNLPDMSMSYDSFWTLLSLIIAICASGFALNLLKVQTVRPIRLALGGIILGLAIASMHYTGMEAMKVHVDIHYLPGLFFLSIVIAIAASEVALWLALKSTTVSYNNRFRLKLISAFIMGAAICGMHYTGMASAIFTPKIMEHHDFNTFNPTLLAVTVSALTIIIMMIAFFLSRNKALIQMNRDLADSTSFLKNILESAIDYSIIAIDLQGTILIWNSGAHQNYGYSAEEVENKKTIMMLHIPDDVRSGRAAAFLETALQKQKAEGIFERCRKNGTHFTASVVINAQLDERGKAIGYVLISKDITKQKKLEEQLINTNKELEQFAFVASHDLKAPLRAIESLVSWIMKDKDNQFSEESQQNFGLLVSRAQRMSYLIEGILQYSRVGRVDLESTSVDVKELLTEVIDSLNVPDHFNINIATHLPTISTSKVALTQVFSNLISNAVKYQDKPHGKIDIGFKEYENYYEFFVADDGPGIDPKYHEKIFVLFQTLQPRDQIESAGIGLSIVKKITENQGGKVSLDSDIGKGSIFRFTWLKHMRNKSVMTGEKL